jgi:16S rRNA (adenine1518-N6/adenine1519-N6)-dimethyltransferase
MNELTDIRAIRSLLERHGFRFSKSLGQNFLVCAWVPEQITESAGIDETYGVLEIGPGIGCLTARLSERAGKVVAVELDRSLAPVLEETLEGRQNVEILFGDILKQELRRLTAEKFPGLHPVVCANLPYNITSPVLTELIRADCFESITVMVQKEVAERICARAGTNEYGAFSLFVQWHTVPELLFDVQPDCFLPQPKVTSAVIRLQKREKPPCPVKDEEMLFRVIRAAFGQRRKTLINALTAVLGNSSKEEIRECILTCGFDERIRGEVLKIADFCYISDKLIDKIHLFKPL